LSHLATKCQEHHTLDIACDASLDRQSKDQPFGGVDPQRQPELLRLGFLAPERALSRFFGKTALKTHGDLVDQKHKMMAVIHYTQPGVHARRGGSLETLFAEGISAAAD
jgi:hypothetical protein